MADTYSGDTTVVITLTMNKDLTDATRVLIRYKKPNGLEGYWEGTITDVTNGVVQYEFPTSSEGLDDTGFWTFWGYIYWNNGTVEPGPPVELAVYKQGKTYIAFPYGRLSGAAEETDMAQEAYEITYDNTNSSLVATNVQDAIDEVDTRIDNFTAPDADDVAYDNATSGLTATDVQAAIDEVDSNVDGIEALILQANQLIYVDPSRADTYTEDGTINRPYKVLASAVSAAGDKAVIKVSGTHSDNIALAGNVSLVGMGIGKTILTGTIATGATGNCSLKELTAQGTITVQTDTVITNVKAEASVNVAGNLKAYNFDIASAAAHALSVTSGLVIVEHSDISTSDNASAIVQNGGNLVLDDIEGSNNSASNATLDSSGGSVRLLSSTLNNSGGGLAADIDNGATSTTPNVLLNVRHVGGISTSTAYTVQEGVEGGDPTGTNFSRRPGTQVGYDNTSGLAATTIQAAIDEDLVDSGAGAPVTTPARVGAQYYDTTGDTFYIWNGAAWRSIATSP